VFRNFAVFVDRDGTIIVDVDYLSSPDQLQLIPRSAEAIRALNEMSIPVIVITNQSGIARGIFSEQELHAVHNTLDSILNTFGAKVDGYYYCPHHPHEGIAPYVIDCECRKPKSGMLKEAQNKFGLNLSQSFVIGDKCRDVQTGKSVGATSIQVATGYGNSEKKLCVQDRNYFAADLFDAVEFIKNVLKERNIF
jgi:D-glycero-D-manno-heptose 1,7-bisphosphate phosphatase